MFNRHFTSADQHPYDQVEWELRSATVSNEKGEILFEQKNVEFPKNWSLNASQIVASKYFHGKPNSPERESSLKQLINRVADTLFNWGIENNYFFNRDSAQVFNEELKYLLLNQYASFNSPVWFNLGTTPKPQLSACFINSIEDTMESILDLAKTEGMLFKYGSGAGVNLSVLRSKSEELSTGGYASGPVSFMRGFDAFAGSIKSGGKTRRAAKMVLLDIDHPDIVEFIDIKANEEKKAWALIDAGYDGSFTGEAYSSVFFQNANHSVRVSDDFMERVLAEEDWTTHMVHTGKPAHTYSAKYLLDKISAATHLCGDPGLQYKDTINKWHTCKNDGPINASNPCSEYVFLDDTACNLASLNLMKFRKEDGSFDLPSYLQAINLLITAMEIIVSNAGYPRPEIEKNSRIYRTLGLGYANLGALLMSLGYPYDSDEGRGYAAALSSVMTGQAYLQSANMARVLGAFERYSNNKDPMLEVIDMHRAAAEKLSGDFIDNELLFYAQQIWDYVIERGRETGFRNAQVSLLAPTGTISFMMDCDTTGIEPDIALVKYKKMVGGGYMTIVNGTVPLALQKLGYSAAEIKEISTYVLEKGIIENAPHVKPKHYAIFDTSFKNANGTRYIHYMGHVKMMAAVQPFLSGAISKTVNMPEHVSVEEINEVYIQAWKLGLKAVAIYRDNSKRLQPLVTSDATTEETEPQVTTEVVTAEPVRRRLPDTRKSIVHKFEVDAHEGYIIVGLYPEGTVGEVFIKMAKQGSTLGGVMDSLAVLISMSLQYGVPLAVLVNKFIHTKFEPSGFTGNDKIPHVASIVDYIFRWLGIEFLDEKDWPISMQNLEEAPIIPSFHTSEKEAVKQAQEVKEYADRMSDALADTQICVYCGALAIRAGSCYACPECGNTSGCS